MILPSISVLANIVLRGLTVASKYVLLVFLINHLDMYSYGEYSLINSIVALGIYFIGLDFYTFYSRDLINKDRSTWFSNLFPLVFIYLAIGVLFIFGLFIAIFFFEYVRSAYFLVLSILVVFEFFSQELSRVMMLLGRSLIINIGLFVRSALWIYPYIFLAKSNSIEGGLLDLLLFWLIGNLVNIILSLFILKKDLKTSLKFKFEGFTYFKAGIPTSIKYLVSSITLKIVFVLDKFFLSFFWGAKEVGVYSYYYVVVMTVQTFFELSIMTILIPKLLSGERLIVSKAFYSLKNYLVYTIFLSVPTLFFGFKYLSSYMIDGNKILIYNDRLLLVFLGILVAQLLCTYPHYKLYRDKLDNEIIVSSILSLFVFLILCPILSKNYSILGVAWSVLIFFLVQFFVKLYYVIKLESSSE
jgi:O-antigen/teichoic acid export membrane protein